MILRKGMSNPDVLNLELVLQGLGFKNFEADGTFDDKTENVIKYIQKAHHLTIDGVVGDNTFRKIDELYQPSVVNFSHLKPLPVEEQEEIINSDLPEKLKRVHPALMRKVIDIINAASEEGYELRVVQGLRTFLEQDKLFKQRPKVTNAKGGQSYHNYGVAADLAFVVFNKKTRKREVSWDEKLYKNIGRWANQAGLTWGGNWRFVDYPHVQLNSLPATGKLLTEYNRGGLQAVWKKFIA